MAAAPHRKAMEITVKVSRRQGNWASWARDRACHNGAEIPNMRNTMPAVSPAKKRSKRTAGRPRAARAFLLNSGIRANRLSTTATAPNWKLTSSSGPGTLAPKPHRGEKSWKNSTKSLPQA